MCGHLEVLHDGHEGKREKQLTEEGSQAAHELFTETPHLIPLLVVD